MFCVIIPALLLMRARVQYVRQQRQDYGGGYGSGGGFFRASKPWMNNIVYQQLEQSERSSVSGGVVGVSSSLKQSSQNPGDQSLSAFYRSIASSNETSIGIGSASLETTVNKMQFIDLSTIPLSSSSAANNDAKENAAVIVLKYHSNLYEVATFQTIYGIYDEIIAAVKDLHRRSRVGTSTRIIWTVKMMPIDVHPDLRRLHEFVQRYYLTEQLTVIVHTIDLFGQDKLGGSSVVNLDTGNCFHPVANEELNRFVSTWLHEYATINEIRCASAAFIQSIQKQLSFPMAAVATTREESPTSLQSICYQYLGTRKYVPACMPRPAVLLPVLVTCLGGCGSHYISDLLTDSAVGLDMPHESLGSHGSVVS
jgi:hypothetical protein